ncbi:MAG: methylated-DNA--[protein]-cysteine S-methyltransferase [Cytophagales bacterium]|nr:methylated-DNA--[protein]-cysteine S-methyltransferase [Cytophagales bacterium]
MRYQTCITSPSGYIKLVSTDTRVKEVTFLDEECESSESIPEILINLKKQLTEYFNGARTDFSVPLEPDGTDFQKKVWTELCCIPFGKTISYNELASKLGDPKVIRAAAAANGKNPIGIVIPCHRVIGKSGKLVGYAGGLGRKKWLLDHENRIANGVLELF